MPTAESQRLDEVTDDIFSWRRWGPYVSDRAWATVREDYSSDGDAWGFLPHDLARSKAFRWGDDGIAGICDRYQLLLFAPAFWNASDPILKERLFGLTPYEGNHGEDVKEYYFYLDSTPTHSYMKFLYKYPQAEYPYAKLIAENKRRNGQGPEYELLDTGVFDKDRYFDIVVEYAKFDVEDIAIRIEAFNRGPEPAPLHIIPHLWFRNVWSWGATAEPEPAIGLGPAGADFVSLLADDRDLDLLSAPVVHYRLGRRALFGPAGGRPLFTDNETNMPRVFGPGFANTVPYVKDAFHRAIINGERTTNPAQTGTKAALHYQFDAVPPGGSVVLRLRLTNKQELTEPTVLEMPPSRLPQAHPLAEVDSMVQKRRAEADEFYNALHPPGATEDERRIQRQALGGLLWNKQCYLFDVHHWIEGDDPTDPPPKSRETIRNVHWKHLNSQRVLSLPDKWEYPWFAAWDLAFQCVAMAIVDPRLAMEQLWLLLFEQFQHPNGQIPAYEWEFSDLNPPVHAWAVWRVYNMARIRTGKADRDFLERCFHKLLINFTWWINKVDRNGNNIFEGGFLGLDNIAVIDRSTPATDGATLEQSDATGWIGMFCLNMMRIALELAKENAAYEGLATKFFQHYVYVAAAMKHMGGRDHSLWDEQDGFFYDVLSFPDGRFKKFRVRSLVGLIPLFAVERLETEWMSRFKKFHANMLWFLENRRDLTSEVVHEIPHNGNITYLLTIVDQSQIRRMLHRMWRSDEFLSDYGIRSLSKVHEAHPFHFDGLSVGYEPAEAVTKIKGGNSNWRGPIWFPACFLLIESLRKLGKGLGNDFMIPTKVDGPMATRDMAGHIAERLIRIFTRDKTGRRAVYGGTEKFQNDPHWRDLILFYEYFHGDNGAGLGASHQTGWTALIASLIDEWRPEATP